MKKKRISIFYFYIVLVFLCLDVSAQVGIGTTGPKTTLDINGAISIREFPNEVTLFATNNDINLGVNPFSFYRVTSVSDFIITGLIPVTGADGQLITIMNTSSNTMILANDSNLSTLANRIFIAGEKDYYLTGRYTTATLKYNASLSKWVLQNKLNSIETWYHGPVTINSGNNYYTAMIPEATTGSSASVNFHGNIDSNDADDLYIEYVEARSGGVLFRIYNNDATVNNVTFSITINKI